MMPNDERFAARRLIIAIALCGAAGWIVNGWRHEAVIAALEKTYADAAKQASEQHATTLAEAIRRSDALQLEKAAQENAYAKNLKEKNDEIARLTTGRRCLDARVVGVLNRDGAAANGGTVAQTAGLPVRADGPAAAGADDGKKADDDAPYASDTDVAGWINLCRTGYDLCRGDRDRIRRFYDAPDIEGRAGE